MPRSFFPLNGPGPDSDDPVSTAGLLRAHSLSEHQPEAGQAAAPRPPQSLFGASTCGPGRALPSTHQSSGPRVGQRNPPDCSQAPAGAATALAVCGDAGLTGPPRTEAPPAAQSEARQALPSGGHADGRLSGSHCTPGIPRLRVASQVSGRGNWQTAGQRAGGARVGWGPRVPPAGTGLQPHEHRSLSQGGPPVTTNRAHLCGRRGRNATVRVTGDTWPPEQGPVCAWLSPPSVQGRTAVRSCRPNLPTYDPRASPPPPPGASGAGAGRGCAPSARAGRAGLSGEAPGGLSAAPGPPETPPRGRWGPGVLLWGECRVVL